MFTSDESIFCPLPFAHTAIATTGEYQICCQHKTPPQHKININQHPISEWYKSAYLIEIKNSFLQNHKHDGCKSCWDQEKNNYASYRQRILQEYKILKADKNTDKLITVEIQLGNLCNLTCLMCNENSSSAILSENIKLGINKVKQKDFTWNDISFDYLYEILLSGPKIVNIRGGEPLYNKKLLKLIEDLPKEICSTIILHITTNATVWDQRWTDAIKKFRLVRFMFSVDAVGELYEYIRFPGNWKTTSTNIKEIMKLKNVKPLVHCVIQNLNIGNLFELINWCLKKNIYLECENLVKPKYLEITNLPTDLKKQAIEQITKYLNQSLPIHLHNFFVNCQLQLNNSMDTFDQDKWNDFLAYINPRDQIRNNSHKNFLKYDS